MQRQESCLLGLLFLSVTSAVYQAVAFWMGAEVSERLVTLSTSCCLILLVMWVDADSRGRANVYRPYEFGQLVLFFWLPYLPFYLWRTRGVTGLFIWIGFLCLLMLGNLACFCIALLR